MYPKGLQVVGNGVSLLPWRKITGTRSTRPWLRPNPITGTPSDASTMRGKSAGNVVPKRPLGCGSAARTPPAKTHRTQVAERIAEVIDRMAPPPWTGFTYRVSPSPWGAFGAL